ncbi:uncharacterized protein FRV6_14313 [Fusarium oxysporum]|uniref:Uncharacterized protein n=1 Tax=Fusarium oxysporum TaxID=5507 RepID=A0A2H3TR87_FUSOX|nr:uncharacterized protein FRV6_14313 [Fusarium oxysporum]
MVSNSDAEEKIIIIQKRVSRLLRDTDALFLQGNQTKSSVLEQEAEDRQQVKGAGDSAYAALERAVQRLLELPSSRDEVSEQDPNIVGIFHHAIKQFEDLSKTSQTNTYQLGTAAANYDSFISVISMHDGKVDSQFSSWNKEQKAAHDSMLVCQKTKSECDRKHRELTQQLSDARGERSSFGGWVSSGFSNTLDDKISTIEKRIDENKKKYDEAEENEKWNKRLRTEAMYGRKACRDLKVRIKALNKEFATELLRVNKSQLVESSLWRGLLELSSMVEDPKFLSSRDNSLRLVLKVLKADDDKFGSGDRYAHVEERIKLAIIGRWGEDGLKKLLIPGERRGPRGFLANE